MIHRRYRLLALLSVAPVILAAGCATLQQLAALRNVDFALDRVSDVHLAGIDLGSIRSVDDLTVADAGRLALAVSRDELPLDFKLYITAENPADNRTEARLVRMDWTLLLQDRETVKGVFDDDTVLPPGQPMNLALPIRLDLMEFFEGSGRDLLEMALSIAGQGGEPKEISLRASPTIQTPLGPMRYPQPITILSREVGQESGTPGFPP